MLNIQKTKIMDTKGSINETDIIINNEEVENVELFEYLGSLIHNNGDCSREIKRRLAMALKILAEMEKYGKLLTSKQKSAYFKQLYFKLQHMDASPRN